MAEPPLTAQGPQDAAPAGQEDAGEEANRGFEVDHADGEVVLLPALFAPAAPADLEGVMTQAGLDPARKRSLHPVIEAAAVPSREQRREREQLRLADVS